MDTNPPPQPQADSPLPMGVAGLIPHGRLIRMVDRLIVVGDDESHAEYAVDSASPFVDETGRLDEAAFIEMIAQSFAAVHGYHLSPAERAEHKGLLIGVKDLIVNADTHAGDVLAIAVRRVAKFGDFGVVDGEIRNQRGELIAKAEIKVWRPEGSPKVDL